MDSENPDTNDISWQLAFLKMNKPDSSNVFVYTEPKKCEQCGEKIRPATTYKYCGGELCQNRVIGC